MKQYLIVRKNPKTGFNETQIFTGNKNNKPKGWKIIKELSKAELAELN